MLTVTDGKVFPRELEYIYIESDFLQQVFWRVGTASAKSSGEGAPMKLSARLLNSIIDCHLCERRKAVSSHHHP
jgi:hypothetical protein